MRFLHRRGVRLGAEVVIAHGILVKLRRAIVVLSASALSCCWLSGCESSVLGARNERPVTEPCEHSSSLDLLTTALGLLFFVTTLFNCVSFLPSIYSTINTYVHLQATGISVAKQSRLFQPVAWQAPFPKAPHQPFASRVLAKLCSWDCHPVLTQSCCNSSLHLPKHRIWYTKPAHIWHIPPAVPTVSSSLYSSWVPMP